MTAKEAKQVENFRKGRPWTRWLSDEAILEKIQYVQAEKEQRAKISRQLTALGMI